MHESPPWEPTAAQEALEREFVAIFSNMADLFGNPRSHGAIYGLLFGSERPLSMDEIISRLGISKGSASQGLRRLKELGAITSERSDGDRNYSYRAGLELKPLLSGFLQSRLAPGLAEGSDRLKRLQDLLPALPPSARPGARLRLQRIGKWHRRAASLLPLAQRLLG